MQPLRHCRPPRAADRPVGKRIGSILGDRDRHGMRQAARGQLRTSPWRPGASAAGNLLAAPEHELVYDECPEVHQARDSRAVINPLSPPRACPAHRRRAVRVASSIAVFMRLIVIVLLGAGSGARDTKDLSRAFAKGLDTARARGRALARRAAVPGGRVDDRPVPETSGDLLP